MLEIKKLKDFMKERGIQEGELNKLGSKPNRVFSNQKYCPDCGQALDWSEENER